MVPIKHGSDYHEARTMLGCVVGEIVGEYARLAEKAREPVTRRYVPEPARVRLMVTMTANRNWIEFTLRYVVGYRARQPKKDRLFTRILEEFDKTDNRVGIADSTLNIEKLAPLEVTLKRK